MSVEDMLNKLEIQVGKNSEFEIDVYKECHNFSADVISRVAFSSNSEEGKRIFQLQEELLPLVSIALRSVYIPGFRFIPTAKNRKRWRLNKEIQDSLHRLIQINGEKCENSKNLLGLMIFRWEGDDSQCVDLGYIASGNSSRLADEGTGGSVEHL